MDVTFKTRCDGQVDAFLSDGWPVFNEALSDSISSLRPRGAPGNGPSTYWTDVAIDGARRAAASHDERPITGGNITLLPVKVGRVVASFDFDDEDEPGEATQLDDFLELLAHRTARSAVRC